MGVLTVILAAIVAAFIFGIPGGTSKAKSISATAQKLSADEMVVTFTGGPDSAAVETISWRVTPGSGPDEPPKKMGTLGSILNVGTSLHFTSTTPGGYRNRCHVIATAHFSDSSPDQVILDIMV
jgi:hypothetical protein